MEEFNMIIFQLIVIAIIAYLLGSINLAIIIGKALGKGDIREQGSGNAGTTNTLRILGKGPALIVFIWDVIKGVLAVVLARFIAQFAPEEQASMAYVYGIFLASVGAILGHNFPIYFGFKGGKGVATSIGVVLAIEWQIGLACLITGVLMVALFNMVSIGSIIAAILYPVLVIVMGTHFDTRIATYRLPYIIFALILSLSIIIRHKANIIRIREGKENPLIKPKNKEEV